MGLPAGRSSERRVGLLSASSSAANVCPSVPNEAVNSKRRRREREKGILSEAPFLSPDRGGYFGLVDGGRIFPAEN